MSYGKSPGTNSDEWCTPREVVHCITPYLRRFKRVWCPFDTERSHFVRVLRVRRHDVTATHIDQGRDGDFFRLAREKEWVRARADVIVSNPPYSQKTEVLTQLFELGRPFAMLLSLNNLFEGARTALFKDNKFELLCLTPRIHHLSSYVPGAPSSGSPTFQSAFVCSGVLPKQIMFSKWRD